MAEDTARAGAAPGVTGSSAASVFDVNGREHWPNDTRVRRAVALMRADVSPPPTPSEPLPIEPRDPPAPTIRRPQPAWEPPVLTRHPTRHVAPRRRRGVVARMAATFTGSFAIGLAISLALPDRFPTASFETTTLPEPTVTAAAPPQPAPQPQQIASPTVAEDLPATVAAPPTPVLPTFPGATVPPTSPSLAAPPPLTSLSAVAPTTVRIAPAPTDIPAPAALTARVYVNVPAGEAVDYANSVAATLTANGYDVVGPQVVDFTVSRSNVRFYHPEDAAAAQAVAALAAAGPDRPADARDFTHVASPTQPGAIELWIAGEPPAAAPRPPAPPVAPPAPAAAPVVSQAPTTPPVASRNDEQLQRVIDESVAQAVAESRRVGVRINRALNDIERRIERGLNSIAP